MRIENFRLYGEKDRALVVPLRPGLTALVGENDAGKTAIIDALRLALGTRDQEFFRLDDADFHQPGDGSSRRTSIWIRCKFERLSAEDTGTLAEFLTYETANGNTPVFYLNWKATSAERRKGPGRAVTVDVRSGVAGDGPQIGPEVRKLLLATYLRPLRDAERALSSGRGSRLAQILQFTREIQESGGPYDPGQPLDPGSLSVLGIGDLIDSLLASNGGIRQVQNRLNSELLSNLSFTGDQLRALISVSGTRRDPDVRLRQLLEKLELELRDGRIPESSPGRGLGSNNLLFLASELLLLNSDDEGFPILVIEEPEAHLHPQRQLRLMKFLQEQVARERQDCQSVQIVLTTHSPNLASVIDLNDMVLLHGGKAFPMASGQTALDPSDYGFLSRFLDVTKANLFFARGLLIVEGDAENILLPTLARLMGRDLAENGVSVINVGGIGLRRFARIYQRNDQNPEKWINVPIACVTDLDVMPDRAPYWLEKLREDEKLPDPRNRHWRVESDFHAGGLDERRREINARASGQNVKTFIADKWTLEYDLAYFGLAEAVRVAAELAKHDEAISLGKMTREEVVNNARNAFAAVERSAVSREELSTRVYAEVIKSSKATIAHYLAALLEEEYGIGQADVAELRKRIPPYLVQAIEYVTRQGELEARKEADAVRDPQEAHER